MILGFHAQDTEALLQSLRQEVERAREALRAASLGSDPQPRAEARASLEKALQNLSRVILNEDRWVIAARASVVSTK